MAFNKAIMIVPVLSPSEVADTITYGLIFYLQEESREETVRTIVETFEPVCFMAHAPPKGNIVLLNFARTMVETEDALLRGKSIGGVKDVKLLVLRDVREYSEWVDREIDKKIQEKEKVPERVLETAL